MSEQIGALFNREIESAMVKLRQVTAEEAELPVRPGGWTRKQILGHLLDSCANNRQRFVCAALHGEYHGPTYDQQGWVQLHGYEEMKWQELLSDWHSHHRLLARLTSRIPEES